MVLDRIKQYIDIKGITIAAFERSIGMSNASFGKSLKKGKGIGSDKLEKILSVYTDLNPEWLLTGNGNIFKTKCAEKVINSNDNLFDNGIDNKRNVQKRLSNDDGPNSGNEDEIIFETKCAENVTNENGDVKGDPNGDKRNVQKTSPNETPEIPADSEIPSDRQEVVNMFSGCTDEEVQDIILREYENHLMDMLENGRVIYPETVNMWLKQKDEEMDILKKKIWQYESLYGPLPPESNKAPMAPVSKRRQVKPRQP